MQVQLRTEAYDSLFSGFRGILEKSFIHVDYKLNAKLILQEIKNIDADVEVLADKIRMLSEDEWSTNYVQLTLQEMDSELQISDEFLQQHAVHELNQQDLLEVKWELMKAIVRKYATFTKEFYDSLKYSQNQNLTPQRYGLMMELMSALKKIHEVSKKLTTSYSQKKFNKKSFIKFSKQKIAIEHLLLRVFYILLNINQEEKLDKYRNVLSKELMEYTITQNNAL